MENSKVMCPIFEYNREYMPSVSGRAMLENEIPPAMRVDIYFINGIMGIIP